MLECPKCKNDKTFFFYRWHLKKHELTKVVEDDETVHYETVNEQHIECDECNYLSDTPEGFGLAFQEARVVR